MKIIDLLNKIANGEEVPKKIKYKNKIYEWKEYDACYGIIMTKKGWVKEFDYVAEENGTYFYLKHCYQDLNDEVEILEEQKKIPEKLDDFDIQGLEVSGYSMTQAEYLLEDGVKGIRKMINWILDYLKSKGDE